MRGISSERAVVVQEHHATGEGELSLHVGDIVCIIERDESGWWGGFRVEDGDQCTGWFPGCHVQLFADVLAMASPDGNPLPDPRSPSDESSALRATARCGGHPRALQQQQQQKQLQRGRQQCEEHALHQRGQQLHRKQRCQQNELYADENEITPRPPALMSASVNCSDADMHSLLTHRAVWRGGMHGSSTRASRAPSGSCVPHATLLRGEVSNTQNGRSGLGACLRGNQHCDFGSAPGAAPYDHFAAPCGNLSLSHATPRVGSDDKGDTSGSACTVPWQFTTEKDAAHRGCSAAMQAQACFNSCSSLQAMNIGGQLQTPCWGQTPEVGSPKKVALKLGDREDATLHLPASSQLAPSVSPETPIDDRGCTSSLEAVINISATNAVNILTEAKAAEICHVLSEINQLYTSELRESQAMAKSLETTVHKERACKSAFQEALRSETAEYNQALLEVSALRRQIERERVERAAEKQQFRSRCEELTACNSEQGARLEQAQQLSRQQQEVIQEMLAMVGPGCWTKLVRNDLGLPVISVPDPSAKLFVPQRLRGAEGNKSSSQGDGVRRAASGVDDGPVCESSISVMAARWMPKPPPLPTGHAEAQCPMSHDKVSDILVEEMLPSQAHLRPKVTKLESGITMVPALGSSVPGLVPTDKCGEATDATLHRSGANARQSESSSFSQQHLNSQPKGPAAKTRSSVAHAVSSQRAPRGQHSPRGRRETPPSGNVREKVGMFERRCSSDTPSRNRVPSSLKRGASGAPVATPFGTGGRQRRGGRSMSELPSGAAAMSAEAADCGQRRSAQVF